MCLQVSAGRHIPGSGHAWPRASRPHHGAHVTGSSQSMLDREPWGHTPAPSPLRGDNWGMFHIVSDGSQQDGALVTTSDICLITHSPLPASPPCLTTSQINYCAQTFVAGSASGGHKPQWNSKLPFVPEGKWFLFALTGEENEAEVKELAWGHLRAGAWLLTGSYIPGLWSGLWHSQTWLESRLWPLTCYLSFLVFEIKLTI